MSETTTTTTPTALSDAEKSEIRSALESRMSTPSYIDLSENHKNDDMFALHKNTLRSKWKPTMGGNSTSLIGMVQWNNIQPPSVQCGINDMYINCTFTLKVNFKLADNGDDTDQNKIKGVFAKENMFVKNINSALYNTRVDISGQSITGEPYIDMAIKRLYDPDMYDPACLYSHQDKHVNWNCGTMSAVANHKCYLPITYNCSSPLLHPFFNSKNDLAGVNAFTIQTNYNLSHLFIPLGAAFTSALGKAVEITYEVSNLDWTITYNQINYKQPLKEYTTLIMWEQYFTEKNSSDQSMITGDVENAFNNNVRDLSSAPIVQYALIVPRIEEDVLNDKAKNFAQGATSYKLFEPYYKLNSLTINVNSNPNAYSTSDFEDIVHCCRYAGYLGTNTELTVANDKYQPVYAFSSLQYRNMVGSIDTYRFNVSQSKMALIKNDGDFLVYYVMMQPALFISGLTGGTVARNLGAPESLLVKSDSDIDEYIALIEAAGYSGGSLKSFIQNLKEKLKKSRFLSTAGNIIRNILGLDAVKQGLSSIPTVGNIIGKHYDQIQGAVDKGTNYIDKYGYGVSLF